MAKLQIIRTFLRRWWRLTSPFWRSKERWKAGGLLALAMAFNIANVSMTVRLNTWSRDFSTRWSSETATNSFINSSYSSVWPR